MYHDDRASTSAMKRGFLNDKKNERDGLGPLGYSQPVNCFLYRPDRLGSSGWGMDYSTANHSPWAQQNKESEPWIEWRKPNDTHNGDSSVNSASLPSVAPTIHSRSTVSGGTTPTIMSDASSYLREPPFDEEPDHHRRSSEADERTTSSISSVSMSQHQNRPMGDCEAFFQGQPLLPSKTMGVPKAALNAWYGQKPEKIQLSKESFLIWNDGGMPHLQKFTCIFCCPLTGEVFASGRYGDPLLFDVQPDEATASDVVWYKKKTLAEHGAAARAYDCFSYRHYFGTSTRSVRLGLDTPYLEESVARRLEPHNLPPLLPSLSADIEEKLDILQKKFREQVKVIEWNKRVERMQEEYDVQEKAKRNQVLDMETEEYRRAREGT